MKKLSRTSKVFSLRGLVASALSSIGILFFGVAAAPADKSSGVSTAAASSVGTWSIVPSANTSATEYNQLFGIACPSSADCWAAGYYYNGSHSQTLIEHWDGTSWSIVPSPNTSSGDSNFLLGLTCASATDCWAVGHYNSGNTPVFSTLTEHYDGNSWTVVSSPNSETGQDNELTGVTCTSATDCWAVGYYSIGNPALPTGVVVYQTLIEHWNGTSWTIVNSPNSSPAENNNLHSVYCQSTSDCWAVGGHSSAASGWLTLIEHYDGMSWNIVSSPNPSTNNYNFFLGVSCTSDNNCWAGGYNAGSTAEQSLMAHYDGASWNVVESGNTSSSQSNFPSALTCASATQCWAVGDYYNYLSGDVLTLIDRYDGISWSVVDSPNAPPNNAGQRTDFLYGVSCASTIDCWAVGYYFNANGVFQTLTEHYEGARPTPAPTATPPPAPSTTPAPTATPTPTATASPTPTPTASPSPARFLNISTRLRVQTDDQVGIGGFIINNSDPKRILLRAIGPSLNVNGTPVAGRLDDPMLELHDKNGALITSNDNWKDSDQRAEIEQSGLAPAEDRESAILRVLGPDLPFTAVIRGKNNSSGVGLVEAYDISPAANAELANISTRGFVGTDDNVMIGGFIVGPNDRGSTEVVVRAIGPSLSNKGVTNALQDPTLELHDANGAAFAANDNWQDDPGAIKIQSDQLAPDDPRESATIQSLLPGNYTAIVRGKDNSIGVALVEAYNLR